VVVFNQTPLPEAVAEINRYRPGRVVLMGQGLAARRISGRFRVGALDEALVQMQQLYRLDARHVGGLVLLG
jgi:transmembrane sensor